MVTCLSAPTVKTGSLYKKKVLLFFGSPRKQGYTEKLVETFLKQVPAEKLELERVDAYDRQVHPCIHCGDCENAALCRFHDMDELDRKIRQADRLLFASPVYCLGFPAPLKAILDRFQRYYAERFSLGRRPPIERPKQAVLLTVSGSPDEGGVSVMEQALRRQFTVMNTKLIGAFHWPETDKGGTLSAEALHFLDELAKQWQQD